MIGWNMWDASTLFGCGSAINNLIQVLKIALSGVSALGIKVLE